MTISDPDLLAEFRGIRCEYCYDRIATDTAHLYHTGMGGRKPLDVRINLCGLCRKCHTMHHNGKPPELVDLLEIVAKREKTTPEAITAEIRRLQRADKDGCEIKRRGT